MKYEHDKMMTMSLIANRYFIYARKSSEAEDRQMLSIESQVKELTLLSKKLKLYVVEVITESKSAKITGKREKFEEVVNKIKSGKGNGLIVWHPDRLSRNPEDSAKIVSLIDSNLLQETITPSQTFRNNPMDKFMLGFFMMQAKFENDSKGVNVKRGLKTKAENGWLPSGAKPGYMNDKYAEKGSKKIHPDPQRFLLIKKAWDLMLTGVHSPVDVFRKLNKWGYRTPIHKKIGGKPMSRSMIYKVFTDPFYYGEFEYPVGSGIWHKGKHKPMITKEEFDRVQVFLGNKGRPRPKTHEFTYTGLLHCGECNAMITAEEKHQIICSSCKYKFASLNKDSCPKCQTLITNMINPTRLHYVYYHCTKRKKGNCSQKSITLDRFEQQFDNILERIEISEGFKNWAIKHLNEVTNIETKDRNAIIQAQQSAYDHCVKQIDNLVRFKISPQNANSELLSDDEFKTQKEALMHEKAILLEKLQETDTRIDKWVELTEKTFNFACYARHWLANGDKDTKKQILLGIGSNLTLKDEIVSVNLQKPLQFIEVAKKEVKEISPMFEPEKEGYKSGQMDVVYSKNLSLLPMWDTIRNFNGQFSALQL